MGTAFLSGQTYSGKDKLDITGGVLTGNLEMKTMDQESIDLTFRLEGEEVINPDNTGAISLNDMAFSIGHVNLVNYHSAGLIMFCDADKEEAFVLMKDGMMYKIYGEHNPPPEQIPSILNGTLTAGGWIGTSAPYTQTISIADLQQGSPQVDAVYGNDNSININIQRAWNLVGKIVVNEGSITATCFKKKPVSDIPIQIGG